MYKTIFLLGLSYFISCNQSSFQSQNADIVLTPQDVIEQEPIFSKIDDETWIQRSEITGAFNDDDHEFDTPEERDIIIKKALDSAKIIQVIHRKYSKGLYEKPIVGSLRKEVKLVSFTPVSMTILDKEHKIGTGSKFIGALKTDTKTFPYVMKVTSLCILNNTMHINDIYIALKFNPIVAKKPILLFNDTDMYNTVMSGELLNYLDYEQYSKPRELVDFLRKNNYSIPNLDKFPHSINNGSGQN